jgi:predicted nicotinamide N-methyase
MAIHSLLLSLALPKPESHGKETGLENTIVDAAEIREFIRSNLPLAPVPSVPEIRLHKASPKSGLSRLAETHEEFGTPYWAYHWGGGLALARHVLGHPELVAGRVVLDLGAGSGLVGIAAAMSGARHVIAADVDRHAIEAVRLNADANGVEISPLHADLTTEAPLEVDVVLVGDLFYEADIARRVTAFLDRCVASGMLALVGDPWRAHLPRGRLTLLAEYPGGDFGTSKEDAHAQNAVFAFRAACPKQDGRPFRAGRR